MAFIGQKGARRLIQRWERVGLTEAELVKSTGHTYEDAHAMSWGLFVVAEQIVHAKERSLARQQSEQDSDG